MPPTFPAAPGWVDIQQKTFVNWVNEQLSLSGRCVKDVATDFCNGINLVTLVESLQLRKIGKVCRNPTNQLQMLQNVSIAFQAIAEDNVKLVNIGNEDVVNGNLKLILGLLWHLILRYQISSSKSKASPKKLMLLWFRAVLPDLRIANFSSDWNEGIALHALVNFCQPGLSPNWKHLSKTNRVENCRSAMLLAKQHLGVPMVVTPEDFASPGLDELSAMTYLSYFLKSGSPGHRDTVRWAENLLKISKPKNLTTDWNDGYHLCAVVHALGGDIPGWPDLDRSDHVANCQKGIDGARSLGICTEMTARELADPNVDHLSVLAFLGNFRNKKRRRLPSNEKVQMMPAPRSAVINETFPVTLDAVDAEVIKSKVVVNVQSATTSFRSEVTWQGDRGFTTFVPTDTGPYEVTVRYDGEVQLGCPVTINVTPDVSKAEVVTPSGRIKVGTSVDIKVNLTDSGKGNLSIEVTAPSGVRETLPHVESDGYQMGKFRPCVAGQWTVTVRLEGTMIPGSPVTLDVCDPRKVRVTGPDRAFSDEEVIFTADCSAAGDGELDAEVNAAGGGVPCVTERKTGERRSFIVRFTPKTHGKVTVNITYEGETVPGFPRQVAVLDIGAITVSGDGLHKGRLHEALAFVVNPNGNGGDISVDIEVEGKKLDATWKRTEAGGYSFSYTPTIAGVYSIDVRWNSRHVTGIPYHPRIIDHSEVVLVGDLTSHKDENDKLALEADKETTLTFDIQKAGPGIFTAQVLGPDGRLTVDTRTKDGIVVVSFTAKTEGDHYIHLFWCDVPLKMSPMQGYCPGRTPPVDYAKVTITGQGKTEARATVPAEFIIDGRKAGHGTPEVRFQGIRSEIPVTVKAMKYDRYKCNYTAPAPGSFLLYVSWSGKQIPGSPLKVNVSAKANLSKITVSGDCIRGTVIAGQEMKVVVNTQQAGAGELTASCMSARQNIRCEVINDGAYGQYKVMLYPSDAGRHNLQILYDGENVPGSPFNVRVGDPPDPEQVKVFGPGVEDGIIQTFQSRFLVETQGAGAGQLAVKIRGPRGAFKVDMKRESQNDRTILCRYDPLEPGVFVVSVTWSGKHVPGSPFEVHIVESLQDLQKFKLSKKQSKVTNEINDLAWTEDI